MLSTYVLALEWAQIRIQLSSVCAVLNKSYKQQLYGHLASISQKNPRKRNKNKICQRSKELRTSTLCGQRAYLVLLYIWLSSMFVVIVSSPMNNAFSYVLCQCYSITKPTLVARAVFFFVWQIIIVQHMLKFIWKNIYSIQEFQFLQKNSRIWMDQPPKLHDIERTVTKTNAIVKSAENNSFCNYSTFLLYFISFTKYTLGALWPCVCVCHCCELLVWLTARLVLLCVKLVAVCSSVKVGEVCHGCTLGALWP